MNHSDGRMDSDANHTVRDILLTSVDEAGRVVVQTCPVSFAPGVVVGAHVKYWVNKLSFGWGASKSTTQGGIFDLIMYITFDCAEIAAF